MKLALIGTGRMGTAVESVATERGHSVSARFNSGHPIGDDVDALRDADCAVDFSLPDAAVYNIEQYCRSGTPAVVGTTGWYDRLEDVRAGVDEHDASILYAPNFSIGVAILVRSLRSVTPLLDQLSEYDAFIHEVHHVNKLDSPSGTALMLGEILLDGLARKSRIEAETQHGRIDDDALHVTSTRGGGVIGKHTITLDSPYDEITLRHQAKNRQGFAFGAVKAAEWLRGRKGLFTLDDMLEEWLRDRG